MIGFPNAKINLGLRILNKRQDGYHNIYSIFAPISLTDILEFFPAKETSFTSSGIRIPNSINGNLVTQAYEILSKDFKIEPLEIRLEKIIPIGAGMGGGSADGSFMLKLLNDYYQLKISAKKLKQYASKLGADCPFFIDNEPALVEEIGNQMTPIKLDLTNYHLVLINPGIHISTKEAYANLTISTKDVFNVNEITKSTPEKWNELGLRNDFETSVFPIYPEIGDIKKRLEDAGAIYSAMTGTGSTVFGIFNSKPENISIKKSESLLFCKFI